MGSKIKKNINSIENLFNPNLVFMGDVSSVLEEYPKRSKNLESSVDNPLEAKCIDEKFVKDGFMYLLRGAKKGQETGFYSREYARKNTIQSLGLDPYQTAFAQCMNGNTPFISATTDLYTAASFAKKERIYVLRIPVEDVDTFCSVSELMEQEYMIPDFISKEEITRSFRYDKVGALYRYLTEEIGLDICPADLGATLEDIVSLDYDKLERIMDFNGEENEPMDYYLNAIQDALLESASNKTQGKTFLKK